MALRDSSRLHNATRVSLCCVAVGLIGVFCSGCNEDSGSLIGVSACCECACNATACREKSKDIGSDSICDSQCANKYCQDEPSRDCSTNGCGRPYVIQGDKLIASVIQMEGKTGAETWGTIQVDSEPKYERLSNRLLEEALRLKSFERNPFPESLGTLPLKSRLSDMLSVAQASHSEKSRWYSAGLQEHASIGSFAKLCLELLVIGAPPRLVQMSIDAQAEELLHAQIALAFSSSHDDRLGIGRLQFPEHTLAIERDVGALRTASIREGLEGEGSAALALFLQALEIIGQGSLERLPVGHRVFAELLWSMAIDEAHHAELAYEILEWLETETGRQPPKIEFHTNSLQVIEI